MMEKVFDFKKEYKDLYSARLTPSIVDVKKARFIAIQGKGNPNDIDGEYKKALNVLYSIAYTLKMSYKMDYQINGYYKYVVPPLEGFWWQEDNKDFDINNKDLFNWISVIRLPDFITKEDFDWAVKTATIKKKIDCSKAEYKEINEGLCVQIMHIGPFDDEYKSVNLIDEYIKNQGYIKNLSPNRLHHEIYLTDARKVEPSKYKQL